MNSFIGSLINNRFARAIACLFGIVLLYINYEFMMNLAGENACERYGPFTGNQVFWFYLFCIPLVFGLLSVVVVTFKAINLAKKGRFSFRPLIRTQGVNVVAYLLLVWMGVYGMSIIQDVPFYVLTEERCATAD